MANQALLKALGELRHYYYGPIFRGDGSILPLGIDCRPLMWRPKVFKLVVKSLAIDVKKFKPEAIAGGVTEGVAWGFAVANYLNLPFILVRKEPRQSGISHGIIEGEIIRGRRVVLIDDSLLLGTHATKFVKELKLTGFKVIGCAFIEIVTNSLVKVWQKQNKLPVKYLFNYTDVVNYYWQHKYIDTEMKHLLDKMLLNPYAWHKNKADFKIFKQRLAKQKVWRVLR